MRETARTPPLRWGRHQEQDVGRSRSDEFHESQDLTSGTLERITRMLWIQLSDWGSLSSAKVVPRSVSCSRSSSSMNSKTSCGADEVHTGANDSRCIGV